MIIGNQTSKHQNYNIKNKIKGQLVAFESTKSGLILIEFLKL